MIVFPNCKINLGLHIIRKRSDGFHDLDTVFYPIPFYDILEVIESPDVQNGILFTSSGLHIECDAENNLCVKAYRLLEKDHPGLPSVKMHLHKAIPSGAGLGGGSADGAFALRLLNEKFHLHLGTEQLAGYALQLGSDCPFFITNQPCLATGRGEITEPLNIDLGHYTFVLVNPGIHVSTGHVFSQVIPALPEKSMGEIIVQPLHTWKSDLKNDFEEIVTRSHPEIGKIKTELYDNGAIYAAMTGSGSSVYGIFEKDAKPRLSFPSHYLVKELQA